jgi:hypothetical protein
MKTAKRGGGAKKVDANKWLAVEFQRAFPLDNAFEVQ